MADHGDAANFVAYEVLSRYKEGPLPCNISSFFLAMLEFLRKAGCVPPYFQSKKWHLSIFVQPSSLTFSAAVY